MKAKAATVRKTHPAIATIKQRVEERVTASNLSKNEASRRAGLGLSYVNDLLRDRVGDPSREALAKLGVVVDTDVGYFLGEQNTPRIAVAAQSAAASQDSAPSATPYFEIGLTDPDGFFKLDPARMGTTQMPLANGTTAYCIAVPDDTMAPRYKAGEIVIVSARKPVSAGGFAVIRQTDDRVAIREIVAISLDKISVRCLNDQAIIEMPRADVKSLERVVGCCELV